MTERWTDHEIQRGFTDWADLADAHNADGAAYEARIAELEAELARVKAESLRVVVDGARPLTDENENDWLVEHDGVIYRLERWEKPHD